MTEPSGPCHYGDLTTGSGFLYTLSAAASSGQGSQDGWQRETWRIIVSYVLSGLNGINSNMVMLDRLSKVRAERSEGGADVGGRTPGRQSR